MAKPVKSGDPAVKEMTPSGADVENIVKINPVPNGARGDNGEDGSELGAFTQNVVDSPNLVENPSIVDPKDKSVAGRAGISEENIDRLNDEGAYSRNVGDFTPYGELKESNAQPAGGPQNPAHTRLYLDEKFAPSAIEKIAAMMALYPDDTPDEHIVYGYGGYRITVKDLREIAGQFNEFRAKQGEGKKQWAK